MKEAKKTLNRMRINETIRAREVRLIDETGQQVGIKPISEALSIARQKGLDLVEVGPQAIPPVCKLLDYSKYKYEQQKRFKEERKKHRAIRIKEVRFRPNISEHDFGIKLNYIRDFLNNKCKVRVVVRFTGREMNHKETGLNLLDRLKTLLEDVSTVEQEVRSEGFRLVLLLTPKKTAIS